MHQLNITIFKLSCCLFLLAFVNLLSYSQETNEELIKKLSELSIEELIKIKIVTASKIEQNISDAPAIITVITDQQIIERGYRTLAEAIISVPGISVWNDNLISSISMRGFNSIRGWNRAIKIMINGQPVSFRTNMVTFIDEELIPIKLIKRIEIIRGPGSALYGANAFMGVINIITKDPPANHELPNIIISANSGTKFLSNKSDFHSNGMDVYFAKKIRQLNIITAITYLYSDKSGISLPNPVPLIYDTINKSEHDLNRPLSFFSKLTYKDISLSSNFQKLDNYGEFTDFSVLTHNNRLVVNNWFIRGDYNKTFGKNFITKMFVAYSKGKPTKKDHIEINNNYPFWIKREIDVKSIDLGLECNYILKDKNRIIAGVDYTNDDQQPQNNIKVYKDSNAQEYFYPDNVLKRVNFNNLGLYSQFVYYPINKLGITSGVRLDFHNIYDNVFTPRIVVVYNIYKNYSLKLLYGHSFKPPTSRELFDVAGSSRGNLYLKPQFIRTHEISIERNSKHARINCSFFYNHMTDIIELVNVNDNSLDYTKIYKNISTIKTIGFETELMYSFKKIKAFLNLSHQTTANSEIESNTSLVPKLTANLGLNFSLSDYFNLYIENNYVGKRISPKPENIKFNTSISNYEKYELNDYFLTNFTLTTKNLYLFPRKEIVFSFVVKNCLDIKYVEPGYINNGIDIPQQGRLLFINISQEF